MLNPSAIQWLFKQQSDRRRDGGFTLIELMVVIVIISIIIAGGFISYSPDKQLNKTEAAAQQMKWLIEQGIKHAIIHNKIMGVSYNSEGFYLSEYRKQQEKEAPVEPILGGDGTVVLASGKDWQPFSKPVDLGITESPDSLVKPLEWRVNRQNIAEATDAKLLPIVIIYPSGFLYPSAAIEFLPQSTGDGRLTLRWSTDGQIEIISYQIG